MVKRVLLCAVPHGTPCDCCYDETPSIDLANKAAFAKLTQNQKQDLLITNLAPWYELADLLKDFEQVNHVQLYELYQYGRQYSQYTQQRYESDLDFFITAINVQYDVQINYQTQRKLKQHILVDGSQGSRLEVFSKRKDTLLVVYFKTVHIDHISPLVS